MYNRFIILKNRPLYALLGLLIIAIAAVPVLGISYLYCENLTKQYAADIRSDILSEVVASGETLVEFKVLKYKEKAKDSLVPEATVYIVTDSFLFGDQHEVVCQLSYRYGKWNIEESARKSAWPYSYIPDLSVSIGP